MNHPDLYFKCCNSVMELQVAVIYQLLRPINNVSSVTDAFVYPRSWTLK